MQVKDKFLEKVNVLILVLSLCFSHNLFAQNIYEKIFNYNSTLKNSSANFIQTHDNYLQEGIIFFGDIFHADHKYYFQFFPKVNSCSDQLFKKVGHL